MTITKTVLAPAAVCLAMAGAAFLIATSCKSTNHATVKDVAITGGAGAGELLFLLPGRGDPKAGMICVASCSGDPSTAGTTDAARALCRGNPRGLALSDFYARYGLRAKELRKLVDNQLGRDGASVQVLGPVAKTRIKQQIANLITAPNAAVRRFPLNDLVLLR